jgi:putative FmdB family regulatory protein
MPTYEYRCPEGHDSEDFVLKISEAKGEITCPTCGAVAPRRMSAGSGLLFKGSGFYITDYGKDGKKDQRTGGKSSDGAASLPASASSNTGATPAPAAPASAPAPAAAPATPPKSSGPDK